MTNFPHCPEHIRPILDEFLEAYRIMMDASPGMPPFYPGLEDRKLWIAGAHKLYNNFNGYKPGFILWAVPQFCKKFPDTRYIKSPFTLRFLWEKFKTQKTGQTFDELMDEALEKDRRKSKWKI